MPLSALCFATLTPENSAAQKCLASLVDSQPPESRVHLVAVAREYGNSEQTSTTDRASLSKYQLVLSLDRQGSGPDRSWIVGKLCQNSVADLSLCSARSRQLKGSQICRISVHPQSGVFILWNVSRYHSILYLQADGNSDVELWYNEIYYLHNDQSVANRLTGLCARVLYPR